MTRSTVRITLATLLAAGAAQAAPFTGKGLPADTVAFVHLDAEAAAAGDLSKALRNLADRKAAEKKDDFAGKLAEAGIKADDITDISAGIAVETSGKPGLAGVVRGKFDTAKFNAYPKSHPEIRTKTAGGLTWYASDESKSKAGAAKEDDELYLALGDANTLVFATTARLDKAAAAATGKAASFSTPSAARSLTGSGASLVAYFPEPAVKALQKGKEPAPGEPAVKSVVVSLGETAGRAKLDAVATMTDDAGAQQVNSQASMMLGFFAMGLSQQKPDATAKEKADAVFAKSLLNALKFSAEGAAFKVGFDYPAAKLAAKIAEKQDDILKAAEGAAK